MGKKFFVIGRGFIFPKHKEAIEKVGGEIVETIEEADWVVILTPNYLHYQQIIEAVNKGKNVICEKPLVINSEDCENLIKINEYGPSKIYTILQLRHLPILKEIQRDPYQDIDIKVLVHRDQSYFETWKGDEEKSGGILFSMAIHYIDLVIYLFGEPKYIQPVLAGPKECLGCFGGDNYRCILNVSLKADKENQQRILKINEKEYNVETSGNLHVKVYKDILTGKGINPNEALKSIKVVKRLQMQK